MVVATAEAGTGLFCTWAQGCAPTPYPRFVAPTGAPGPQDYPCLPLGWAALAQATHLLLLLQRRTPRGPARCTGASWETLSAQGARYGGGEKGQRWACSWASRDPGPRSLGRHAKRPQRAGRSGARPSRILRSASSAQAAFRFPHQPRHVQESPYLGRWQVEVRGPRLPQGPAPGRRMLSPAAAPAARRAPPAVPPLRPRRLLPWPPCPAPSPRLLSHKEPEMAVARGSLRTPDLQPPATKGRDGLIPSGFRVLSFPTLKVEKEGRLLCSCLHHQRHLPPQKEGSFGFIRISPESNYFQVVISPSHLYRLPVLF